MTRRIDSHQHCWRPARGDHAWLRADFAALAPLVRDFLPEHLAPLLQTHGVERTVLVQAADSQVGGHDSEVFAAWRKNIAALAALPHVCCKFSGLWGEAPPSMRGDVEAAARVVRPVWKHLLDSFGPARLLWGSDCPVLTLAGDYAGWIAVSQACIGDLPAGEQAQVWRGTAQRFYDLQPA